MLADDPEMPPAIKPAKNLVRSGSEASAVNATLTGRHHRHQHNNGTRRNKGAGRKHSNRKNERKASAGRTNKPTASTTTTPSPPGNHSSNHRRNHHNKNGRKQRKKNGPREETTTRPRRDAAAAGASTPATPPEFCSHRLVDRCTWPQCNRVCPKLHNPFTGEEMDFIQLLKSFGLDMSSVANALGIDMHTLNNMDHDVLLHLLTQQTN